jgi:hypothetical protein
VAKEPALNALSEMENVTMTTLAKMELMAPMAHVRQILAQLKIKTQIARDLRIIVIPNFSSALLLSRAKLILIVKKQSSAIKILKYVLCAPAIVEALQEHALLIILVKMGLMTRREFVRQILAHLKIKTQIALD